MCMTCASLAPAAGTAVSGIAVYGSVVGGAALAAAVGAWRRPPRSPLDPLARLSDDGSPADADDGSPVDADGGSRSAGRRR
jgi:hypothetical protein